MELFQGTRGRRLCLVLIAAAAVVMYVGSISGKFVRDDRELIVDNGRIHSLSSIPTIFATGFIPAGRNQGLEFYRPIVNLSLLTDYQIWKLRPLGYHLTNLVLHAGVSILVFLLASMFLPMLPALAAGLLFAVHPVHTEDIAWISGRTDPLAALFLLTSFLFFIHYLRGRKRLLWASALAFAIAILSKEAVILFPALFTAYAVWGEKRSPRSAALTVLPFLAVCLAYLICRQAVLGYETARDLHAASIGQRLAAAPANLLTSLLLVLTPGPAEPFHRFYSTAAFSRWWLPAGYFVTAAAIGLAAFLRKRQPLVSLCIAWLLLGIAPVLNIIPLPRPILSERLMYIPSIGAALLIGWMVSRVKSRSVFAGGLVLLMIIAFSSLRTAFETNYWKSDEAFWVRAVELAPNNAVFRNNLGIVYLHQGKLGAAKKEFLAALAMEPVSYAAPHLGLASVCIRSGAIEESFPQYDAAIRINPKAPNSYNNLGVAYALTGRYRKAERALKKAIAIWPDYTEAHLNLAKLYRAMGKHRAEQQQLKAALACAPTLANTGG